MSRPEEAVIEAAVARGYLGAAQLAAARDLQARLLAQGRPVELLPVLARWLTPAQRDALRGVYLEAQRQAAERAGAPPPVQGEESTQLLDRPVELPPPPGQTAAGASTIAAGAEALTAPASRVSLAPPVEARTFGGLPAPPPAKPMEATVAVGPPTPVSAMPEVPGYQLLRELGRGGMGVVWAAREEAGARRPVALKVLLAGPGASPGDLERFQLEAKATAKLSHPGIVAVLGQGKDASGHPYIAMELIEGESLEARVSRDGPLPPREVARIGLALARALEHAHGLSILHRDLKPHNVLVGKDGEPRLTDFGLAKVMDASAASLTSTGKGFLGTPAYMAPEQANGEKRAANQRTDVYGLGALLYHLLTGRPPFTGDTLASVLFSVLQHPPVPPSQLVGRLPRDLETIVLKCLEKGQPERYQSMEAVASDLARFLERKDITARRAGRSRLLLRWAGANRPVALALGLCVLAVGLAGWVGGAAWLEARRAREELARQRQGGGPSPATAALGPGAKVPAPQPRPKEPAQTPSPPRPKDPAPAPVVPAPPPPPPKEPEPPSDPAPPSEPAPIEPAPSEPAPSDPAPAPIEPAPSPPSEPEPSPIEPAPSPPSEPEPSPIEPAPSPPSDPEPSPPSEPAPPPLDPVGKVLAEALAWVLDVAPRRAAAKTFAWRETVAAARVEARARGVPLLVVFTGREEGDLPPAELLELLPRERPFELPFVPVLAQDGEKKGKLLHATITAPDGATVCALHRIYPCAGHDDPWTELRHALVGLVPERAETEEGKTRIAIGKDEPAFLLLVDAELRERLGCWTSGTRGDGFPRFSPADFSAVVKRVTKGAKPLVPADKLSGLVRAAAEALEEIAGEVKGSGLERALDALEKRAAKDPEPLRSAARALGPALGARIRARIGELQASGAKTDRSIAERLEKVAAGHAAYLAE